MSWKSLKLQANAEEKLRIMNHISFKIFIRNPKTRLESMWTSSGGRRSKMEQVDEREVKQSTYGNTPG